VNHPTIITPVINTVVINDAHIDAHFCPSLKIIYLTVHSSVKLKNLFFHFSSTLYARILERPAPTYYILHIIKITNLYKINYKT
jgi:hypothetical protein